MGRFAQYSYLMALVVVAVAALTSPVLAQEVPAASAAETPVAAVAEPAPAPVVLPNYNPRDFIPLSAITPQGEILVTDEVTFQSLLFNPTDINTIITTLNRRGRNAPQQRGFVQDGVVVPGVTGVDGEEGAAKPYYPPIPTKRVISLSGVVWRSSNDWIVWLNGHKLVPGAKLPELVDIKVERDRVHLKWFDIGMAKIIALTLRPRQTYDITSGVLLTSSEAEGR